MDKITAEGLSSFLRNRSTVTCKVAADYVLDHPEHPAVQECVALLDEYAVETADAAEFYWLTPTIPLGPDELSDLFRVLCVHGRPKASEAWASLRPFRSKLDLESDLGYAGMRFRERCGAWAGVIVRKLGFGKAYGKGK